MARARLDVHGVLIVHGGDSSPKPKAELRLVYERSAVAQHSDN